MKPRILYFLILFCSLSGFAQAQSRKVSGQVTEAGSGQPLPGVSVNIKGLKTSTQTGPDGKYNLTIPEGSTTLVFTYIGYETREMTPSSGTLNLQLKTSENNLNEIVVVAYGTANKSTYTGSASVVNASELEKRPVANVSRALQGAVPGVQSVASAGQPGSDASIRIRGIGSINASSDPLYVVDGVPYSGNINSINSADIASITVLKDAAASALYGSRGANGVIIITTKAGRYNSKPQVSLSTNTGFSQRAVKDYEFVNTDQYFQLQWEALRNNQLDQGKTGQEAAQFASTELVSNLKINPYGPNYPNPVGLDGQLVPGAVPLWQDDWSKSLSRTGIRQEVNLGVSGGSADSRYFVSGGYLSDKGFIVGSGFRRFNTRVNYNTKVNKWFEAGINVAASSTNQDSPPQSDSDQGNFANFGRLVSNIYPVYERNADGSFKLDAAGNQIYDYGNYRPSAAATGNNLLGIVDLNKYNNKQDALLLRGNLQFNILDGLKLKSSVNTDYNNRNNLSYSNPFFGSGIANGGSVTKGSVRTVGYTINNLLDYTFDLGSAHHFNVLGGQEVYVLNISNLSGSRSNFGFDGKTEPNAASLINSFNGSSDQYKLSSFLGKLDYNYNQRYFFSASFRRDGSSRFSPESRWGNFWSVGASWNAKSEAFLANTNWLNSLTVRTSYGAQGNDNLGSYYAYQDLYSIYNSLGQAGLVTSRLPTPGLKWETNLNFNAGIDFAILNHRISGTFEVFQRQSKDLLFSRPLAPSLGFTAIDDNIGSLRNNGYEGQLNFVPVTNQNIHWTVGLNFGHYNNRITKLPQKEIISGNVGQLGSTKKLTVGSSVYDFYIREWAGVDPANGKPMWFKDAENGRTTTSVYADATQYYSGSALPDFYGGLNSSIRYKQFELYALVAYNIGGKVLDLDEVMIMHTGENTGRTWSSQILDRWTPTNTNTNVPRLTTTATNWNSISTRFLYDASYVRLKNLSLSYSLPEKWANQLGMGKLRLYARGENLLTYYKHKGLDPEQAVDGVTYYRYPSQKTYTFGLDLSF